MNNWTSDELHKIGSAEELELASVREDGTLRPPVIIWVVRDGDDVYVRSVNGRGSSWTQARRRKRLPPRPQEVVPGTAGGRARRRNRILCEAYSVQARRLHAGRR
jgi:Uncharacterized protein conserved in bacteria (DUF2255)